MHLRFHRPLTRAGACLGVLGLLFLVGCGPATPPSATATAAAAQKSQEVLKQRAQARWARMVVRDFAGAYAFETPAYRATVDPKQYASRFGGAVSWVSATVDQVRVDPAGDRAEVEVTLQFQAQAPLGGGFIDSTQTLAERWVLIQGDWWLVQDDD